MNELKVKSYILSTQAAALGAARPEGLGSGLVWEFLCPQAFEATWNGGPAVEDIEVRLADPGGAAPSFVQSAAGGGVLTLHAGRQLQLAGPDALWVRGPVNHAKDGVHALETLVDASTFPATIAIEWRFTRPGHTVRFEAGEPFCAVLPVPRGAARRYTLEEVTAEEAMAACDEQIDNMARAAQRAIPRPAAPAADAAAGPADVAVGASADRWAAELQGRQDLPKVSCICPTYGRVELLEEAIQSFLLQDYPGDKELIVLNDFDQQTLRCDHPEVRVINLPGRLHSVGEKYKAAVALCAHDVIFVWHDDDIYLPHRISLSVAKLDRQKGFFKGAHAWFWNDGKVSGPDQNVFHGGCCFTRDLFIAANGYPHIGNTCDVEFEHRCRDARVGAVQPCPIAAKDVYYVYRWNGTGSYHLSQLGQDGSEQEQVAARVRDQVAKGEVPLGEITLTPRWRADYQGLCREFLQSGASREIKAEEEEIPYPPPFHAIAPPPPLPEEAVARLFTGAWPLRISVVVPSANEGVLLRRTVEQFQATLPADSEIIVVDNGSRDGCADFLAEQERPGVRLIRTPAPLGVSGARNRGLAEARGEIVVFADAHIDVPERWWQPIAGALRRPEVGIVGPGIGVMGLPKASIAYGQRIAEPNLRTEWMDRLHEQPYPVPTLGGGFVAMRHDVLESAGSFDMGMPQWGSEDLEICVRYWLLGHEVWVVPEVTVMHYFRSTNPNRVDVATVTHNLLRVALLHFGKSRMERVTNALKGHVDFGKALAQAAESSVLAERAAFAARRTRDDDWLFERFKDTCRV